MKAAEARRGRTGVVFTPRAGSRWNRAGLGAALALGWMAGMSGTLPAAEINPPLGAYVNLSAAHFAGVPTWAETNRLVFTPYFYWYDIHTQAHILNADGSDALTTHPPTLEDFSFRSVRWHETQLRDMIEAGIDVVLPVYWGEPSQRRPGRPVSEQPWSYAGIPPLVAARAKLVAEGLEPPRIGLFYDTSTLEWNAAGQRIDLTTAHGQQWFYETVRDFFSLVPPAHWALVEGRPLVFLYSASFASRHDQSCIEYLRTSFARDFGGRVPWVVREISWQVNTEDVYAWGGALGLKNPGVASLGPGYDHTAVPGRDPLIVDREDGAFFERNWIRFLRRPSNRVFIETWNEFHEGTDIAESLEYGRQYIELNRRFVDLFKQGVVPPRPPGPYTDVRSVEVLLGATNQTRGLLQVESGDGVTAPAEIGGSVCREAKQTEHAGRYVYLRIDDSFKWDDLMEVEVEVEYFDHPAGRFTIEFDGSDLTAPFQGAYSPAGRTVFLGGARTWKTAVFRLRQARFLNSQNAGADLRLALQADSFHVRRVVIHRLGVPAEAGAMVPGVEADLSKFALTDWGRRGAVDWAGLSSPGLLGLGGNATDPGRLWVLTAGLTGPGGELLARVRLRRPAAGDRSAGGVGVVAGDGADRVWLEFVREPDPGLRLREWATGASAFGAHAWLPNTWYWLRLAPEIEPPAGVTVLRARLWPADGETPEPGGWLTQLPLPSEWAGVAGHWSLNGPESADGVVEFDFLLMRKAGLPVIQVRLPGLKPAWLELHAPAFAAEAGFGFTLEGAPNRAYRIDRSTDLADWQGQGVMTDPSGLARWTEPADPLPGRAYYRAVGLN